MKRSPMPPRKRPMPRGNAQLARTPLRHRSKKQEAKYRERRAMLGELYPDPVKCVVEGCTRVADDPHEPLQRGRGGSITDPENVVAICRPHHDELTFGEPEWAYEQGLKVHSWDREAS